MSIFRQRALKEIGQRPNKPMFVESTPVSAIFGINVFDRKTMQQYLSPEAFSAVINAIDRGTKIDRKMADQIAAGMKTWALERGATHYTHWFHPFTDATAEKHESFLDRTKDGSVFENFSGHALVQQEPDASSFPTGGLRNTFEARGYTAWDPSSPAFVFDQTLCIPTIFVSYNGEALDQKTPLLRSLQALDRVATDLCRYFDKDVNTVTSVLGIEQEYFAVDSALFRARPDLQLTGRTLLGHIAAKDQQLEDHYFGSIPPRIMSFMKDFETEAYKLGILLRTRHNEVAPNQYECAPLYEDANLAIDHNLLLMTLMQRVSDRHNLRILFHEKPFSGINGSGKHCNWSMITDTGVNLLSPGKTPRSNLQFLTFFVCTIRAVFEHHHLLMSSVMSLNNSLRLGASEAPPAIMSIFVGSTLTDTLKSIVERVSDKKMTPDEKTELKLDVVGKIPEILPDNTDRNRTSPFAFTGNRFEFRAVGSSSNCAQPMMTLNTAVAQQIVRFKNEIDALMDKDVKKDEAIFQTLRKFISESQAILFEGNGYSDEWRVEAEARGLRRVESAPSAFQSFLEPSSINLFTSFGVLTEEELKARVEIFNEIYVKKIQIEARVVGDLAINHIVPTAIRYQSNLIENVCGLKQLLSEVDFNELATPQLLSIKKIGGYIKSIREGLHALVNERKKVNEIACFSERAKAYTEQVWPYMKEIRKNADKLERIIDDEMWPLPKYRELLFIK
ncbi:MAG: glutamine synthetase III [Prevotellaceae bacterium]|jgi:glutamine synthetase|nr:glutamine synthetase III [Prevotellaceae bacterium]